MDLSVVLTLLGVALLCIVIGMGRCIYWFYQERDEDA